MFGIAALAVQPLAYVRMRTAPARRRTARPRTVVFIAAPDTQILDVAGPFQVFVRAGEIVVREGRATTSPYRVVLASTGRRPTVTTNCGLLLTGSATVGSLRGPIDTLLVAGGWGVEAAAEDPALVQRLVRLAGPARRVGSICTGAFLLAAAGLLDGRRAATHWKWAARLGERYPTIRIDHDALYVRDGKVYSTAGVTAGMDLALALVEDDLGSQVALQVARELVLYLRRSGGQSQFSAALELQSSDRRQIEEVRTWVAEHLRDDLRVERLAAQAGMSPRHFARVFRRDTGTTPAEFVERVRVEAARRRLEESRDKLEKVAADCGLGSAQGLRRSFVRVLHVPPHQYREQFRRSTPG